MAQDYVVLNEKDEKDGLIAINKSVFQSIADISLNDIDNVVPVEAGRFTKAAQVRIENNKLKITADIKVKYGANVSATCELLQNKIYENILYMTGYKAADVMINVVGFEI